MVYTLDRATGEFLWATPTTAQNVITHMDGSTGAVTENPELIDRRPGHARSTSNAATFRVSRLNSTATRWTGWPGPRYLSA